ncbi:MAG: hypothetical protein ACREL1_05945 [bacterium]
MKIRLAVFFFCGMILSTPLWAADQALPYCQAGNSLFTQKNYAQAKLYYHAAIRLNPSLWQAFEGVGNCDYVQGDSKEALRYFNLSLSLHPNNPPLAKFVQTLQSQVRIVPTLPSAEHRQAIPAARPTPVPYQDFSYADGEGHWIGGGGLEMLLSSSDPQYGPAFGIGGNVGYGFDPNFALLLETNFLSFNTGVKDFSLAAWTLCPSFRLFVMKPNGFLRPYILGGLGMTLWFGQETIGDQSAAALEFVPVAMAGVGLDLSLEEGVDLYLQVALINSLFEEESISLLPLQLGVEFN